MTIVVNQCALKKMGNSFERSQVGRVLSASDIKTVSSGSSPGHGKLKI